MKKTVADLESIAHKGRRIKEISFSREASVLQKDDSRVDYTEQYLNVQVAFR